MNGADLKFDEVGYWSELKLQIVEEYGSAYTRAFSGVGRGLKRYYIDAYSGPGVHISKRTKDKIEGSPSRALKIVPKFDHFYFIDIREDKTDHLETLCGGRTDVSIFTEDSNQLLVQKILPS
ncbi:MAG TPA: three-Cys-motif partner protein TcmP, partial [Candidatus Kapabacteria bacterium]|nr:three-Cys-motif partner protein TcmP [Candidatus Kapabacteria bacterium]